MCIVSYRARIGPDPRLICLPTRRRDRRHLMTTDPANPAPGVSDGGTPAPAVQPPNARQSFRDLWHVIVALWWRFFDWLAMVSWKTLLIVFVPGPDRRRASCTTRRRSSCSSSSRSSSRSWPAASAGRSSTARAGHASRRDRAARADGARSADGSAAGADRAAFPVQHAGKHRPADPHRPAARVPDAAEPHPLSALGDAADARGSPADARPAGRSLERVPRDHGGAHGGTPRVRDQRAGRA